MKRRNFGILLGICLLLLAGCAREAADGPLTQAEIAQANEAFQSQRAVYEEGRSTATVYPTEISCFFTSYYADPSEIALREFLQYCPIDSVLEDSDAEEFRTVIAAILEDPTFFSLPSKYVVPVHRYRKADVSALLTKYAGITIEELVNTEGVLYLEEYDAFYNFTSDFGPGRFECVGGERTGDTIRFWSETDEEGNRKELTVRKEKGTYVIQSFLLVTVE